MRRRLLLPLLLVAVLAAAGCVPSGTVQASSNPSIMGPNRLTAADLASWFRSVKGDRHRLPISIDKLARLFIEESEDEGVRGDIAFAQSVLETGWFWFPDAGQVRPSHNNYAGIGAVDGGNNPNKFSSPRQGVRAQIQHLRAYGDRSVTRSKLEHSLVDPRFHLVSPKGQARNWPQLSGRWASSSTYGQRIVDLYTDATRHAGKSVVPARDVATNPKGGHYLLFGNGDVEARDGARHYGDPSFTGDIARAIAVMPDGKGYIVLDGWGGLHKYGSAKSGRMAGLSTPIWYYWDIARDLAITRNGRGLIVLDGLGGKHARGNAPRGWTGYWQDWDIARAISLDDRGGIYVLDGWGGVHVANAKQRGNPYWPGWDVGRDIWARPDGKGYAVLDGLGGVHRYGSAPSSNGGLWAEADRWAAFDREGSRYVAVQWGGATGVT